ncbi:hypothetical protein LWC33_13635 [Pseudonocardia sp. RS11V-5]|uniref:hypothetical protein n=1 Tax=Pseudonocardia terrae TaxID=2905831 RepID=UPI001E44B713|nr:hypothetical protein [Pseudonocardia terrae]MCE3552498.1 hypothetical protein [Pseudonocardia terrae]
MTFSTEPTPARPRRRGRTIVLAVAVLGLLVVVAVGVVVNLGSAPSPFVEEPARSLTARDWALIAKDPEAHSGERVVVHGLVTQFDSTTGTKRFRAEVDAVPQEDSISGTNTILTGSGRDLDPVVEGDLFTAEVTVEGAASYDTALGGSTTAPELEVDSITVTGHVG